MNSDFTLFEKFITSKTSYISYFDLALNSALVFAITFLLRLTYIKLAKTLSNKKSFANNFFILTFTTMLIIMIVKSSLALSLGLIGALSIVRFRSAIKEPEELIYLFLNIAVGLGLGAGQVLFTILGVGVIISSLWFKSFFIKKENYQTVILKTKSTTLVSLENIIDAVAKNVESADLKRFDEGDEECEAIFYIDVDDIKYIQACRNELLKIHPSMKVSFIDNRT